MLATDEGSFAHLNLSIAGADIKTRLGVNRWSIKYAPVVFVLAIWPVLPDELPHQCGVVQILDSLLGGNDV